MDRECHKDLVQREKREKSFAQQVDECLKGTLSPYIALKICNTPQCLLDVGCSQLPMLYTQRHLRDAVKPIDRREHQHGLTVEQIKMLPLLLEKPAMIFDSVSKRDSLVIVTYESDCNGNPVMASVKPNGKGKYEVEEVNSNFVTSVYGRSNFVDFFRRTCEQDCVLYINKEQSQEILGRWGEQYSELASTLDFDIIIHQSRNIVKENFREILDGATTESSLREKKRDSVLDKLYMAKKAVDRSTGRLEENRRFHKDREDRSR